MIFGEDVKYNRLVRAVRRVLDRTADGSKENTRTLTCIIALAAAEGSQDLPACFEFMGVVQSYLRTVFGEW